MDIKIILALALLCCLIGSASAITASFSASPTSGFVPLSVSFMDRSTGAISWKWDFGDGSPTIVMAGGSDGSTSHTYAHAGNYVATLTLHNGASASRSITVISNEPTTHPTTIPTPVPTTTPTTIVTTIPTTIPTTTPTSIPTTETIVLTVSTTIPTTAPTTVQTTIPTPVPTEITVKEPTQEQQAIFNPTIEPAQEPTFIQEKPTVTMTIPVTAPTVVTLKTHAEQTRTLSPLVIENPLPDRTVEITAPWVSAGNPGRTIQFTIGTIHYVIKWA